MKIKYFVVGDIHGRLWKLKDALEKAGYESNRADHQIITTGDHFDRGRQSAGVYKFLKAEKAICVKGNHELLLEDVLKRGYLYETDVHNGLYTTLTSFGQVFGDKYDTENWISNTRKLLSKWLEEMPFYYETKTHIILHAGFYPYLLDDKSWREYSYKEWSKCSWMKTPEFLGHLEKGLIPELYGKKVVVGHWYTSLLGAKKGDIIDREKFAAVDISDAKDVGIYAFEEESLTGPQGEHLDIKEPYVSGYDYGKEIYVKQVEQYKGIEEPIILVFPDTIENISISFIRGLFESSVKAIGTNRTRKKYIIECKNKRIQAKIKRILAGLE